MLISLIIFLVEITSAAPQAVTYQGRLFNSDGDPLTSGTISLTLELRDPSGTCLLYSELHNDIDMQNSDGYVRASLGSGTPSASSPFAFDQALSNQTPLANVGMDCPDAPMSNSYTPSTGDGRMLRAYVNGDRLSPDQPVKSVPYSMFANSADTAQDASKLEGNSLNDIRNYSDSNLGGIALPDLSSVVSGQSIRHNGTAWELFSPPESFSDLQSIPTGLADGDDDVVGALSCADGQIAKYSSGTWQCAADNSGVASESDPTVPANIKDGISWSEVSGKPVGVDDQAAATAITIASGGQVGIGTTSPDASAALDLSSSSLGFVPPKMTEANRDAISSPTSGLFVYNTDSNTLQFYDGSSWSDVDSGGGGGGGGPCDGSAQMVGGAHDGTECSAAGGAPTMTVDGCLCRVTGGSCPSGWSQHSNWSTTAGNTCNGAPCTSGSCSTSGHAFNNSGQETCSYSSGGVNGYIGCSGGSNVTCYATMLEIGCK